MKAKCEGVGPLKPAQVLLLPGVNAGGKRSPVCVAGQQKASKVCGQLGWQAHTQQGDTQQGLSAASHSRNSAQHAETLSQTER